MILAAAMLVGCLAAVNYLLHRDFLYPGFLQALLWFGAFVLLGLTQGVFIPISSSTILILVSGVLLFSMGAFVGSYHHVPYLERNYVRGGTIPGATVVAVLGVVVTLGLVLYVRRALELASTGPSSNAFVNLRYAVSIAQDETGGFGVTQYFLLPAYVLVGIMTLKRRDLRTSWKTRVGALGALLIGLSFGLLSSGRGPVLALLIIILGIPLTVRAVTPGRTVASLSLLSVALFVIVGLALGKGGTLGSTLGENWTTLKDSFLTYALGGIPSLDVLLHSPGRDVEWGANTFRSVLAVLHAIGFHVTAPPLVQPYVDIPIPENVYTVHQPYIKDFGALGGSAALFVIGFLHAFLYRLATLRKPHAFFVFLFALSLFPLVMQVFQDMYFSLLSMWVQYVIYAVLFFVVLSNRRYWPSLSAVSTRPAPSAVTR